MPKRKAIDEGKKKSNHKTTKTEDKDSIGRIERIADIVKDEVKNTSSCDRMSSSGKKSNLKIMSWNVAGIRALLKKNGMNAINTENADIVCLQEVKCEKKDIPEEIQCWSKYRYKYYSSAQKKGYSGVCLFSKVKPIQVKYGIGISEHDNEGRVITAEFQDFYLVAVYVPNSGRGLVRLQYRQKWNKDFTQYLKSLDAKKGVILCGDLNVSHKDIDLENPKTNTKTAGFTKEERHDFTVLLAEGFVDSFRHLYPNDKKCYTFWSHFRNARQKDIGWRLDYFVLSNQLIPNLCDNQIRKQVMGSDHCPIILLAALEAQAPTPIPTPLSPISTPSPTASETTSPTTPKGANTP